MADKNLFDKIKIALIGLPISERTFRGPSIETYKPTVKPASNYPTHRVSVPSLPIGNSINDIGLQYRVVTRDWIVEVVPIIRKLVKVNPDMGQALDNIVTLGNTGHKIFFDRKVPQEMVDKMRNHLKNRKKLWSAGAAGMNGLVNKMFSQLLIGGALSNEWVPAKDLSGVETLILVNPEDIYFKLEKGNVKYTPYQRVINNFITPQGGSDINLLNLVKLNTNTYQYYALNGDTEIPYGFPPYLASLDRIRTQNRMNTNIDYVVDQLGLMGFLQALIGKPGQNDGESDIAYDTRLDQLLQTVKTRLNEGVKDGTVVGFKDDAEFEYNSISKGFSEALELYKQNELQVASGLKQDATLWGRDYNTSETQITVIFIKMLSQLANIQNIVKTNLEFGYALELRLAGFNFESLDVKFNRSTLQDDLKYQQAEEIKVRNTKEKMIMGLINQEQAADELDYEVPAYPQPMVSWDVLAGGTDPVAPGDTGKKKATRQGQKNKSAKKTRDTNKPIAKNK